MTYTGELVDSKVIDGYSTFCLFLFWDSHPPFEQPHLLVTTISQDKKWQTLTTCRSPFRLGDLPVWVLYNWTLGKLLVASNSYSDYEVLMGLSRLKGWRKILVACSISELKKTPTTLLGKLWPEWWGIFSSPLQSACREFYVIIHFIGTSKVNAITFSNYVVSVSGKL